MIKSQISTMIQSAIDGEVSYCEVFRDLKDIAKYLKEVAIPKIEEGARDEAREFVKDEPQYGMIWTIGSSRTFFNLNEDQEWKDANAKKAEREAKLTTAWKASQDPKNFFNPNFEYADEFTGEIIPIVSVKTPAKEWVSCKQEKPKLEQATDEGKKMIFD